MEPVGNRAIKIVAHEEESIRLEIESFHIILHGLGHGSLSVVAGAKIADHEKVAAIARDVLGADECCARSKGQRGAEKEGLLEGVPAGDAAGGGIHGGW